MNSSSYTLVERDNFTDKTDNSARLKKYLITTRNNYVRQSLDNRYRDQVPRNELKVFCVSNKDYWDHRDLSKDEALPFLQLSGILSLRKHCISMVASSQLFSAMKYIRDGIPAVLGDIDLWVQSGAGSVDAERREEIRITLNALEARLTEVRYCFGDID